MDKVLLWPDTHLPKEDRKKVKVMMKIVESWQPDHLVFLGDLDDSEGPSRFAAGTKEEVTKSISNTNPTLYEFLRQIRKILPNAKIDWFMGNHEQRWMDYVAKNAKALEGFVTFDMLYPMKELGIDWHGYAEAPRKMWGDFHVHHGSVISQHAGDSARKEHEKWGVSGFSGHTHRIGSYHKTNMNGSFSWFECGHLSDVKAAGYVVEPNWQSGFAYAYVDKNKVYPALVKFEGNTAILDGIKFQ